MNILIMNRISGSDIHYCCVTTLTTVCYVLDGFRALGISFSCNLTMLLCFLLIFARIIF